MVDSQGHEESCEEGEAPEGYPYHPPLSAMAGAPASARGRQPFNTGPGTAPKPVIADVVHRRTMTDLRGYHGSYAKRHRAWLLWQLLERGLNEIQPESLPKGTQAASRRNQAWEISEKPNTGKNVEEVVTWQLSATDAAGSVQPSPLTASHVIDEERHRRNLQATEEHRHQHNLKICDQLLASLDQFSKEGLLESKRILASLGPGRPSLSGQLKSAVSRIDNGDAAESNEMAVDHQHDLQSPRAGASVTKVKPAAHQEGLTGRASRRRDSIRQAVKRRNKEKLILNQENTEIVVANNQRRSHSHGYAERVPIQRSSSERASTHSFSKQAIPLPNHTNRRASVLKQSSRLVLKPLNSTRNGEQCFDSPVKLVSLRTTRPVTTKYSTGDHRTTKSRPADPQGRVEPQGCIEIQEGAAEACSFRVQYELALQGGLSHDIEVEEWVRTDRTHTRQRALKILLSHVLRFGICLHSVKVEGMSRYLSSNQHSGQQSSAEQELQAYIGLRKVKLHSAAKHDHVHFSACQIDIVDHEILWLRRFIRSWFNFTVLPAVAVGFRFHCALSVVMIAWTRRTILRRKISMLCGTYKPDRFSLDKYIKSASTTKLDRHNIPAVGPAGGLQGLHLMVIDVIHSAGLIQSPWCTKIALLCELRWRSICRHLVRSWARFRELPDFLIRQSWKKFQLSLHLVNWGKKTQIEKKLKRVLSFCKWSHARRTLLLFQVTCKSEKVNRRKADAQRDKVDSKRMRQMCLNFLDLLSDQCRLRSIYFRVMIFRGRRTLLNCFQSMLRLVALREHYEIIRIATLTSAQRRILQAWANVQAARVLFLRRLFTGWAHRTFLAAAVRLRNGRKQLPFLLSAVEGKLIHSAFWAWRLEASVTAYSLRFRKAAAFHNFASAIDVKRIPKVKCRNWFKAITKSKVLNSWMEWTKSQNTLRHNEMHLKLHHVRKLLLVFRNGCLIAASSRLRKVNLDERRIKHFGHWSQIFTGSSFDSWKLWTARCLMCRQLAIKGELAILKYAIGCWLVHVAQEQQVRAYRRSADFNIKSTILICIYRLACSSRLREKVKGRWFLEILALWHHLVVVKKHRRTIHAAFQLLANHLTGAEHERTFESCKSLAQERKLVIAMEVDIGLFRTKKLLSHAFEWWRSLAERRRLASIAEAKIQLAVHRRLQSKALVSLAHYSVAHRAKEELHHHIVEIVQQREVLWIRQILLLWASLTRAGMMIQYRTQKTKHRCLVELQNNSYKNTMAIMFSSLIRLNTAFYTWYEQSQWWQKKEIRKSQVSDNVSGLQPIVEQSFGSEDDIQSVGFQLSSPTASSESSKDADIHRPVLKKPRSLSPHASQAFYNFLKPAATASPIAPMTSNSQPLPIFRWTQLSGASDEVSDNSKVPAASKAFSTNRAWMTDHERGGYSSLPHQSSDTAYGTTDRDSI